MSAENSSQKNRARKLESSSSKARSEGTVSSSARQRGPASLLASKESSPLLLIVCPDRTRRERAVEHMIECWGRTVASSHARPSLHRHNASECSSASIARLADSAVSIDLFNPLQITWLKDIEEVPLALARNLVPILPRFSKNHRLILSAGSLPAKHPLREACASTDAIVEFEELRGFELERWLERESRRLGFTSCGEGALHAIAEAAEGDLDRAAAMTAQLAAYCEDSALTRADVETLFIHHAIPGEFDFLDALVAGNSTKAELMVSSLLQSGKNPFMLLGMINRSFANYLTVRTLLDEGAPPNEIRQALGLSPWVHQKALSAAQRCSADGLVRALKTLVTIDSKLKNRSLGPELLMSDMISGVSKEIVGMSQRTRP